MILEIVATNLKDVKNAEEYGADRIELISAMTELGLTPSYGLIKEAVSSVDIPINVIIRPHNQSFVYDENDLQTMVTDIQMVKKLGVNGIVIGPLTHDKKIDEQVLQVLLEAAGDLDVTFHRAFDFANNQVESLKTLMTYKGITSILTAGGDYQAPEAVKEINQLIDIANDSHLKIMIGNGLRLRNLDEFCANIKQVNALHFGSDVRINRSPNMPLDRERVKKIKAIMKKHS